MADTLDAIISDIQSYVVAPLNAFGVGGFVFDVAGESIANLSTDITDHYTEDNKALQDHIAIHPKKITLKGYVGELIFSGSNQGSPFLQKVTQKLTEISAYLPTLSAAATQIAETLTGPTDSSLTLRSASNIYGLVKNVIASGGEQARQQNAYTYFKALMSQGILMGIQTPWEFMTNMAIESIAAIQPEVTEFITDFSVTFKEIRIAQTLTTAFSTASTGGTPPPGGISLQGAAAFQCTEQNPLGNVPGLPLTGTPVPGISPPGAQGLMTGASSLSDFLSIRGIYKAN